ERFRAPLADALAGGIAGVAGGASVDRRPPATGVPRQVRAHVDLAQLHHEVAIVVAQSAPSGIARLRSPHGAIMSSAASRLAWPDRAPSLIPFGGIPDEAQFTGQA